MQEIPWKTGSCSHQCGLQQGPAPVASSWDPLSLIPKATSLPCWAPQCRRGIPILEPVQMRPRGWLGHSNSNEESLCKGQRGLNWIFIRRKPNSWDTTGNGHTWEEQNLWWVTRQQFSQFGDLKSRTGAKEGVGYLLWEKFPEGFNSSALPGLGGEETSRFPCPPSCGGCMGTAGCDTPLQGLEAEIIDKELTLRGLRQELCSWGIPAMR